MILLANNTIVTVLFALILLQESLNWKRAHKSRTVECALLVLQCSRKLLVPSHMFVVSLWFVSCGHVAIKHSSYLRPFPNSASLWFRKRSYLLSVEPFLLLLSQPMSVFPKGSISLLGDSKHHTHRFSLGIFLGKNSVEAWDYFHVAKVVFMFDLVDALWSLAHLVSELTTKGPPSLLFYKFFLCLGYSYQVVLVIYSNIRVPMGVSEAQDVVHVFIVSFQLLWSHKTPSLVATMWFILLLLEKSCAIWIRRAFLGAHNLLISLWSTAVELLFHLLLNTSGHTLFHSLSSVDWRSLFCDWCAIADPLRLILELLVTSWRGSSSVSLGSIGAKCTSHGTVELMRTRRRAMLRVSGRVDFVPINNRLSILSLNIGLLFQLQ